MRLALDRNESARNFDILGGGGLLICPLANTASESRSPHAAKTVERALTGCFPQISAATLRVGTKDADGLWPS